MRDGQAAAVTSTVAQVPESDNWQPDGKALRDQGQRQLWLHRRLERIDVALPEFPDCLIFSPSVTFLSGECGSGLSIVLGSVCRFIPGPRRVSPTWPCCSAVRERSPRRGSVSSRCWPTVPAPPRTGTALRTASPGSSPDERSRQTGKARRT